MECKFKIGDNVCLTSDKIVCMKVDKIKLLEDGFNITCIYQSNKEIKTITINEINLELYKSNEQPNLDYKAIFDAANPKRH